MTCYDLHSHSTVSDGSLSPEHLVARGIDQGVDVLALTDHDGTEGITAAQAAAQGTKLSLVTGVEISVTWGSSTIHILGLKLDHKNEALQKGLKKIRDYRKERAVKIAERLEKSGISGAYEGASQYASPVMLGSCLLYTSPSPRD